MLHQLRIRLTYANVMSTVSVFLTLGTSTAYATHLIVNSSDVVDGSLVSADLKNGAAVGAVDVKSDALTGAKIDESSLAQVRSATLGGLGRSAASPDNEVACDPPEDGTFVRCVSLTMTLPDPARVLLNGRITAATHTSSGGYGSCRWGGVITSGTVSVSAEGVELKELSLVGVTSALPAGTWTFAIECQDSYWDLDYIDAWVTGVAISPS